jgi:hypothetical protein
MRKTSGKKSPAAVSLSKHIYNSVKGRMAYSGQKRAMWPEACNVAFYISIANCWLITF